MANYIPISASLLPGTMTPLTPSGGGDTFDAKVNAHYILLWINGGTANSVTIDDPSTSTGPEGSAGYNPDAVIPGVINVAKPIVIQGSRFVNPATGRVGLTYSGVTGSTMYIIGPIPNSS